jgi:hypothetical protein
MRREVRQANESILRESYRWGQTIDWYPFDYASTDDEGDIDYDVGTPGVPDNDLYDEGGVQARPGTTDRGSRGRHWKEVIKVQVFQAQLNEGGEDFSDQGLYSVDQLTLIVGADELIQKGLRQVDRPNAHLNDRLVFQERLFNISRYSPTGRIADNILTVTVGANEVKDDERQTDTDPWHD